MQETASAQVQRVTHCGMGTYLKSLSATVFELLMQCLATMTNTSKIVGQKISFMNSINTLNWEGMDEHKPLTFFYASEISVLKFG